ncbi:hypothetical protein PQQ99_09800 [Paraburkholderia sediminicola]|uniref:hypothetical protein n=1 Tax=Paraburkholderia sediminicola TaxID=458836 RepID=UPI0038B6BD0D
MAGLDFNAFPEDRKVKLDALVSIASARLEEISQKGNQVASVAIAGAKYAGGNGDSNDGDIVSRNLFETIHDLAGDAQAFGELLLAMEALRAELNGIA